MATTVERPRAKSLRPATKPRPATKAHVPARKPAGRSGTKGASAAPKKAATKAGKALVSKSPTSKLARKVALKGVKLAANKALESGLCALSTRLERAADLGLEAVESLAKKRPPIQHSLDVAVPLRVAWEEWIGSGLLPEGAHHVEDVERDGDDWLVGRVIPGGRDWEAEVLEERPEESFAWLSHGGSNCAGLITFHRLSERLTRLELSLDVVPVSVAEGVAMAARTADRRAEADLRRFKARVEMINPDLYEDNNANGGT
jgi:uncharacterized membrane protein